MLQRAALASRTAPWRAEGRATLALALPLILTNLTQAGIHATEVVLLGWVGATALAAGALGSNLYLAFLIFGMGLVTAASPMMARELGERRHSVRDIRRTVRQALWAAAALSVPVWLLLWNAEPILLALGQEPELAALASSYMRALQWSFLPALGYLVLRSFVAALEQPIWSLVVSAAALLFNAFFSYALIFGTLGLPALGIVGAGIGATVTNLLMFGGMALVVLTHRRFRRYRLFGRFWRADWQRFAAVWKLGLPIAVTLALEVTVFNAAVFLMGLIGAASLAAHAIAIQIAALSFMVPLGLSQAATVRVGLALGRRDAAGISRAGWTSFALGVGFMSAMSLLMWAMPHSLVFLFLDESDPANAPVIALAVAFIGIAAIFQIVDGAQAVGAGMLRGLQDTTVPMVYAAVGYWVIGIGVGVALGFWFGLQGLGIWIGLASGLAVVALLMVWRWVGRARLGLIPA